MPCMRVVCDRTAAIANDPPATERGREKARAAGDFVRDHLHECCEL